MNAETRHKLNIKLNNYHVTVANRAFKSKTLLWWKSFRTETKKYNLVGISERSLVKFDQKRIRKVKYIMQAMSSQQS